MPYYEKSEDWLHQSALLLQARPGTVRSSPHPSTHHPSHHPDSRLTDLTQRPDPRNNLLLPPPRDPAFQSRETCLERSSSGQRSHHLFQIQHHHQTRHHHYHHLHSHPHLCPCRHHNRYRCDHYAKTTPRPFGIEDLRPPLRRLPQIQNLQSRRGRQVDSDAGTVGEENGGFAG